MENFKKWLSMRVYKRIKFFIFCFIVIVNILAVLIGGILIHLSFPAAYPNIGIGMWQIFTDILDPGFLGSVAANMEGGNRFTTTIEVIIILICMVTFTGTIIGYISNMITQIIENADRGPKQLYLKNHILLLNWNNRAAGILTEYLYTEVCEDVVVLSPCDRDMVSKEINAHFYETGYTGIQKHVKIFVKQGEPYSMTELDAVCARAARAIIVLSDMTSNEGELCTLKTVMMVSQINRNRKDCTIIVETDHKNVYELVRQIQNENTEIVPAYLNKIMGKILAHIALQPELNGVFRELLSHFGSEFYSIPIEELKDIDGGQSEEEIIAQFMERYARAIPILTSRGFQSKDQDRLYLLSEERFHTSIERTGELLPLKEVKIREEYPVPKKQIIILGSNSKIKYIFNSFLAYIENYGEEYLTVYFIDTEKHLKKVPEHPCFQKTAIQNRYNLLEIEEVLEGFRMEEIDTIVILSDDKVLASEYDMGTLVSLIDINKVLGEMDTGKKPELIVEILNPQNYEIVQQYNIGNIIISNKYMSSMVAQLGDDSAIFELIYDMLTFDGEMDDFGMNYSETEDSRELYIKNCGDYFEELPVFENRSQMLRSIYEASGRNHILLGIIYADPAKNAVREKEITYILSDKLDEMKEIRLAAEDKLILYASRW